MFLKLEPFNWRLSGVVSLVFPIITVHNVVVARLCFHRHLWFCSQGGCVSQHGLGPDTLPGRHPWADTPCPVYAGIHTPLSSACWDSHPPAQCMLGYTPPCPVHDGIHTCATPPPGGHCSRRYASCWNAFLFRILLHTRFPRGPSYNVARCRQVKLNFDITEGENWCYT